MESNGNTDLLSARRERLSLEAGGASVYANLKEACEQGLLETKEDGRFKPLASKTNNGYYFTYTPLERYTCKFLMRFVYRAAYRESRIPWGCRECYKVKVIPRSLKELMALCDMAGTLAIASKVGVEINNKTRASLYSGYFYAVGLDKAKQMFREIREIIDADPRLGAEVKMLIKRGCTHYELKFGPSDTWSFDPALESLESCLEELFHGECRGNQPVANTQNKRDVILSWFKVAHRVGAADYLEYTGGRSFFPQVVTYHDAGNETE